MSPFPCDEHKKKEARLNYINEKINTISDPNFPQRQTPVNLAASMPSFKFPDLIPDEVLYSNMKPEQLQQVNKDLELKRNRFERI